MSVKESLKNLARRSTRLCATTAESELRDYRNVEIVLSAAIRQPGALSLIHDPVAYVDFLRGCIEPARHYVTDVKADVDSADEVGKRFTILVKELCWGLPAIEFSVAKELATIADSSRAQLELMPGGWVGDLGIFFSRSSSFGRKGRILFSLVRFMRSQNCLELGTALGMSALFILTALVTYGKSGRLTTVEGNESLFSFSSSLLKQRYGARVACHCGWTNSLLPGLVNALGPIDFMFHDSGHSRDDYIRDFDTVAKTLAPGGSSSLTTSAGKTLGFRPKAEPARTRDGRRSSVIPALGELLKSTMSSVCC